ncbi:MAG: hypothetical protein GX595_05525, partial [Lentisphaerae bacterium]|nr:hypothetical protein [Lentisphaerota bacterium]
MSSSSFYDIRLEAAADDASRRVVFNRRLDGLALPWREETWQEVRYNEAMTLELSRSGADAALRGLLCNEVVFELAAGRKRLRLADNYWFLHELGDSTFSIEEMAPGETVWRTLFEVNLRIVPSPEALHQYKVMAEDLVQVHAGLARDVVSRTVVRQSTFAGDAVRELQPEPMIAQLRETYRRLKAALVTIRQHPGGAMQAEVQPAFYRSGDRLGTGTIGRWLASPGTVLTAEGRPVVLGRALVLRHRPSTDLEEHRHLSARLDDLARLADTVAAHCDQTAALLRHERRRWGEAPREEQASVFQTTYLPRIELLQRFGDEAREVAASFRVLRSQHPFLRQAGRPRGPLRPTALFCHRVGYREAYAVLRQADAISGLLVDSDTMKLHYRSLASMFEYWCFVKTINWLRERYGAPEPRDSFSVVGGVYRPTLEPGQFFEFRIDDTHTLRATYEPSILPWRQARAEKHRYGATLTANPLRPDIFVEFLHRSEVVAAMVLDAKATTRFSMQKIREMSDYARQIFELPSGRQPVRRVFILHRDADSDYVSNLPPRRPAHLPPAIEVFGAAACVPEKVNTVPAHIGRLLRSFIRCCLDWSRDGAPSEGTGCANGVTMAAPAE